MGQERKSPDIFNKGDRITRSVEPQKPVVRVGRGQLGGRRETYRAMSTGEEEDGARSSPEMREHNAAMRSRER